MKAFPFKIAIVGVGPKGLYGLERILAHLKAHPVDKQVEIYLFNKTTFMGSGDVYRSDQPDYLLMNFSNAHINMWPEEAPPPVVEYPVRFSEYLAAEEHSSPKAVDDLYASRAAVGTYLEKGFDELCQNLPKNVQLYHHITEVSSIDKTGEYYSIGFHKQEETHRLEGFQQILITTGHQRHKAATKPNKNRIPFIYPVEETLKEITYKDIVAIKGLGLTFIDAVLALTEGRGGRFEETTNGNYNYTASGNEPKHIFPYSKSGWPMLPKYHFDNYINELTLYTESAKSLTIRQLSFTNQILPLLHQDMEYAYYSTLFAYEKEVLTDHINYENVKPQIERFHHKYSKYPPFSMEQLLEPEFDPDKTTHQNVLEYLTAYADEADREIVHQAHLRAAAVWKGVSIVFNDIYSFSGLDPASHREFDKHYFGKLNRIAYGPPPINLKKIVALAQAGMVDFRFAKSPNIKCHANSIHLDNGSFDISCDVLINARIPKNSLEKEASGLFFSLCQNQLARPFVNSNRNNTYALGTLEINRKGALINTQGKPENITLYGTPTEGVVHDNDTLSRSRNNFAEPWAKAVIKHLTFHQNETNSQTSNANAYTQ